MTTLEIAPSPTNGQISCKVFGIFKVKIDNIADSSTFGNLDYSSVIFDMNQRFDLTKTNQYLKGS